MKLKFNEQGLIPAIIQDAKTKSVLMLGYMNQEAFDKTNELGKVTFFSRSKSRLWTKGEESGNFLELVSIKNDCDSDTLLVRVNPKGPTCHKGSDTCWDEKNESGFNVISRLEDTISQRILEGEGSSYVNTLVNSGINKVAQKVGEEAVEVVIEAMSNDDNLFLEESADLLFHYLILLQSKGFKMSDIERVLEKREK